MPRRKQRENYGNGSVVPLMVKKLDASGNVVKDANGAPVKVQERNRRGELAWRVTAFLGYESYTDRNGRTRKRQNKVQRRVHGTLEEARNAAQSLTAQYKRIDTTAAGMTFSDACKAWSDSMAENQTCAPSKLTDYTTRLSYVADQLGAKPLVEVTTNDLERALAAVKAKRGYSQRTYRDCKRHVKRVFRFALRKHWIVFDPSEGLEAVTVRGRTERRSLDASEFARLRTHVDRDLAASIRNFEDKELRQEHWKELYGRSSIKGLANISCLIGIRLLLSTGMRRGEVLALTWDRVDFGSECVTIDRALNKDAELKEPKTQAGVRTIAVDSETMGLLRRWKAFQGRILDLIENDGDRTQAPAGRGGGTPVVCSCVGGFFNPSNMNRWWASYREKAGFPTLKLHELRHTAATLLLGSGVPVIDVAARLGHDDVSVTLNTYGHAIAAHDRKAANLIGSLMDPAGTAPGGVIMMKARSA